MARSLSGSDHTKGKLDHLFKCVLAPELVQFYFYEGQICPHGHTLRHKMHHWCLQCGAKVFKNQCSFNINRLEYSHYSYYRSVFENLSTDLNTHSCWIMPDIRLPENKTRPRYSALTYRSPVINRAESINLSRLVYSLFWGDLGAIVIKRSCNSQICWNPFHLHSSFNCFEAKNELEFFNTTSITSELTDYNSNLMTVQQQSQLDIEPKQFLFF